MEAHRSLRMLLNTLLKNETLNSWNIYEEKSGAVVVELNIGCKRKSPAQMPRDKERARTFNERRITRSRARGNVDDVSEMEKERCCDNESQLGDTGLSGLVSPVLPAVESRLDPFVPAFSPSAPPRTEEPPSGKPASPSLEPACPITDLSPLTPLLAQAGHCDVASPDAPQTLHVNGHMVISVG